MDKRVTAAYGLILYIIISAVEMGSDRNNSFGVLRNKPYGFGKEDIDVLRSFRNCLVHTPSNKTLLRVYTTTSNRYSIYSSLELIYKQSDFKFSYMDVTEALDILFNYISTL